jgi:hypothetical protein
MAGTTTLPSEIQGIPAALQTVGDIVSATGDVIKKLSDVLPDETRSVIVEVINLSSKNLSKGADDFAHGGFGPDLPQAQIGPLKSDVFSTKSTGVATGVEGRLTFPLRDHSQDSCGLQVRGP